MSLPAAAVLAAPPATSCKPGASAALAWTLLNPGDVPWPAGCSLRLVVAEGNLGPAVLSVPQVPPCSTVELKLELRAPLRPGAELLQPLRLATAENCAFGPEMEARLSIYSTRRAAPRPSVRNDGPRPRPHPHYGAYPGDHTRFMHMKFKPDTQPPGEWQDPHVLLGEDEELGGWHIVRPQKPAPSPAFLSTFGQPEAAEIRFTVNGKLHVVRGGSYPVSTSLAEYLRYHRHLTGTKIGCGEGGCGACTVALRVFLASGQEDASVPESKLIVNACLRPLHSVDNMQVTTIENLGTPSSPHTVQRAIHRHHASQCGMCTPGMVMAIYGHLSAGGSTQEEAQRCIQGNICRCTGYRPIYDAIHEVSADLAKSTSQVSAVDAVVPRLVSAPRRFHAQEGEMAWVNCVELADIFTALSEHADRPHKLVVGNTAAGVVKYYPKHTNDDPQVFINIQHVQALLDCQDVDNQLVVGAAVPLTSLIDALSFRLASTPQFRPIVEHLKLVAHPQVRNVGSWAGNVMLAKTHPDFPSDVCLLLTLLNARLRLVDATGTCEEMEIPAFLQNADVPRTGATAQIIESVAIPRPPSTSIIQTFKIMRRKMNAHAELNAGFLFDFSDSSGVTVQEAKIVLGNIVHRPFLATRTSEALRGQTLTPDTLAAAKGTLLQEVADNIADPTVQDAPFPVVSKEYRKTLAGNLLYKAGLRMMAARLGLSSLSSQEQSAAEEFKRAPSRGQQTYAVDPSTAPVGQPAPKYEGLEQACGTANFTADMPLGDDALFGIPVLAKEIGTLSSIDAADALRLPGVTHVLTSSDVRAVGAKLKIAGYPYKIFASANEPTEHVGQIVALVLGRSLEAARAGAKVVTVHYASVEESPIVTLEQAMLRGEVQPTYNPVVIGQGADRGPTAAGHSSLEGRVASSGQRHFYLETQTTAATPGNSGGLVVTTACQVFDNAQQMLASTFNLPAAKITIQQTRVGGAYGGKAFLYAPVCAVACAAALRSNGPVLVHLDRTDDFLTFSGRNPFDASWTCTFDESGRLASLNQDVSIQTGVDSAAGQNNCTSVNCYDCAQATLNTLPLVTRTPTCTIMRAPGNFEGAFIMEAVIEQIARTMGVDPTVVQEVNHNEDVSRVWTALKRQVNYDNMRSEVQSFNQRSRYQKQGLYPMGALYGFADNAWYEKCIVHLHGDGSVSIKHSGLEFGQGLDTKAVQTCAQVFGGLANDFTMDRVHIVQPKSTDLFSWSLITPTWGSATSETVAAAVSDACMKFKAQLEPYATAGRSWSSIVAAALAAGGLTVTQEGAHLPGIGPPYNVACAGCARVQIDVLTGETQVLSYDLVYDCGKSLNPGVDIGQMEGSVIQALGFCLTEEEVRSSRDGRLLNCGTWDYKVPSGLDIPIEMNVTLLDPDEGATGPAGFLNSKASGEPAQLVGSAVFYAVKDAIYAARKDAGLPSQYIRLDPPASPERVLLACST